MIIVRIKWHKVNYSEKLQEQSKCSIKGRHYCFLQTDAEKKVIWSHIRAVKKTFEIFTTFRTVPNTLDAQYLWLKTSNSYEI